MEHEYIALKPQNDGNKCAMKQKMPGWRNIRPFGPKILRELSTIKICPAELTSVIWETRKWKTTSWNGRKSTAKKEEHTN